MNTGEIDHPRKTPDKNEPELDPREPDEYGAYLRLAPHGFFVADEAGNYLEVNAVACETTGYSRDELLGMNLIELIPPSDREAAAVHFSRLKSEGKIAAELRFRTKTGELRYWIVNAVKIRGDRLIAFTTDITREKQISRDLAESEQKYRSLFDNAILGIFRLHADGRLLEVNGTFARIFGYGSPEEVIADPAGIADLTAKFSLSSPDRQQSPDRSVQEGEIRNGEILTRHRSGRDLWIAINARKVSSPDGTSSMYEGMIEDITARKETEKELKHRNIELGAAYEQIAATEEELRHQMEEITAAQQVIAAREREYRKLFDTSDIGIALHEIITDEAGRPVDYRFLDVNASFEQMTGLSASEITGRRVLDVLPGTEQHWIETYGEVALSGKTIHLENFSSELNRYYEVTAYSPDPGRFATLIQDVTRRREQEILLRETNSFLENLITYANVPIIVWDDDLHITRVNHAFEILIGRTNLEVIGRPLEILFPQDRVAACMRLIRTTSKGVRWETVEIPIVHTNGSTRILLWNSATIYNQEGTVPVATIAQGRDVTDERKLQHEKEQAALQIQENMAKLAILNDGIRNPLTIITMYADMEGNSMNTRYIHDAVRQIDEMITTLDREWMYSEKILNFLITHEHIRPGLIQEVIASNGNRGEEGIGSYQAPSGWREDELPEEIEARLYTILDSIDPIVYVADMKTGEILYLNQQARAEYGDGAGKPCHLLFHDMTDGPCPFCTYHLPDDEAGQARVHRWEFLREQTGRWYDCRVRTIRWTDGRMVHLAIAYDITERREAEDDCRQSELLIRDLLEKIPIGIIVADRATRQFLFVNTFIADLLGHKRDDLIQMRVADLHPPEEASWILEEFQRMIMGVSSSASAIPMRTRDGVILYVDIQAVQVDLYGKPCTLATFTETTGRGDRNTQTPPHLHCLHSFIMLLRMAGQEDQAIMDYTLESSLSITRSSHGLICMVGDDEAVTLHTWSPGIRDETATRPILLSPKDTGVWSECVRTGGPVVINEYRQEPGGLDPGLQIPVTRLLAVPVMRGTQVTAVLGVVNKETLYTGDDIHALSSLGEMMGAIIEGRRTIRDLRRSEDRFRRITELMSDFSFSCTITDTGVYQIDWIVGAIRQITGYTREELMFEGCWRCIVHEEDLPVFDQHVIGLSAGEESTCELRICRKDGRVSWISCTSRCEDEPSLARTRLYGGCRDITESKLAKIALEDRTREYASISTMMQRMCDNVPDMIWAKDLQKRFTFTNKAIRDNLLFASDEQEPLGKTDLFFALREREKNEQIKDWHTFGEICRDTDQITMDAHAPQQFDEYGNVRGSFLFLDVHKAPFLNEHGEMIGTVGSARDVTMQKQAEKALRESEGRYRAIIAGMPDLIFTLDDQGVYRHCHAPNPELLYSPRDNLIGKSIHQVLPPEASREGMKNITAAIATGEMQIFEYALDMPDQRRWFESRIVKSGPSEVLAIVRDITDRRNDIQALRESNKKLRLLTSLTRHDIFNQLSAADLFLHLALQTQDSEQIHEYLTRAIQAGEMIEKTIGFTREYDTFGVVSSGWQCISDTITLAQSEIINPVVRIENQVPANLQIYCDPIIRKVFSTLIENAIRHGGPIERITFSACIDRHDLIICCEDDGCGIPKEEKDLIFEHGYGKNTGIGLFLAREILSITGISIRESGREGEGARFEILVPADKYRFVDNEGERG